MLRMATAPEDTNLPQKVKDEIKALFTVIATYILEQTKDPTNGFDAAALKSAIKSTSDIYTTELGKPGSTRPNFSETLTQWGYIYSYFIHHVRLLYIALSKIEESFHGDKGRWERILERLKGKSCSIGGGPNTDSVGLRLFLKMQNKVPEVSEFPEVHVLDKYDDWKNAWEVLGPLLPEVYRYQPTYHQFNILKDIPEDQPEGAASCEDKKNTDEADLIEKMESLSSVDANTGIPEDQPEGAATPTAASCEDKLRDKTRKVIGDADVITMIKSLSSVDANTAQAKKGVLEILKEMKSGALLLFIDNEFANWKVIEGSDVENTYRVIGRGCILEEERRIYMSDIESDDSKKLKEEIFYYPTLKKGEIRFILIERVKEVANSSE